MASNMELSQRALKVLVGAHTNFVKSGFAKRFIIRGEDAHLWDADGKKYIDFALSAGPAVFGHSNPEYIQALKNQLDTLYTLMSNSYQQGVLEVKLAEKFVQHIPCAEKIYMATTGSEAVQLALRLARAYTGRRYFIRFEEHYHGWLDNVLGGAFNDSARGKPFPLESEKARRTEGRDQEAFKQSFLLPWNDIEVLEGVLERYGQEVAMVIMEPILINSGCCPPRPGYLERVRELCTKYGVVLCFDEVITGFRVALNSAQGLFGVTPDLATFGKAITGGLPLSVVAGKKEIMDLILERKVLIGGTYPANPLGVAASLASIGIFEKDNGAYYRKIDSIQKPLMDGFREISQRRGIPMFIQGTRGAFNTRLVKLDKEVAYTPRDFAEADITKEQKWFELLAEEGVLIMYVGRWYLCSTLTQADIDRTLECAERALNQL